MKKNYPEIYINKEVEKFLIDWKNQSIIRKPNPPEQLKKPIAVHFDWWELLTLPILLGCLGGFLLPTKVMIVITLCWFIYYFIGLNKEKKKYISKMKKYDTDLVEYQQQMDIFFDKRNKYEEFLMHLDSETFNNIYLRKYTTQINISLLKGVPAKINYKNKQGKSEELFYEFLINYFPHCIHREKVIEIFEKESYVDTYNFHEYHIDTKTNAYVPDFYFQHPLYTFYIDIEIDEPYTYSNEPIHYLNSTRDKNRNDYFLSKGWSIIRFSEEQILTAPLSCCKEIAELIFDLTNDDSYLAKLSNTPKLFRMAKWTKYDAQELVRRRYRDYDKYSTKTSYEINLCYLIQLWENENFIMEFSRHEILLTLKKNKKQIRGIWKAYRDKIKRIFISVTWETPKNQYQELFIDSLTSEQLIITSNYDRQIFILDKIKV